MWVMAYHIGHFACIYKKEKFLRLTNFISTRNIMYFYHKMISLRLLPIYFMYFVKVGKSRIEYSFLANLFIFFFITFSDV